MRIGTFLLGGIVGAATVIYLSDRQNRSMMFSAFASPTNSLGKVFNKTKDMTISSLMNAATNLGGASAKNAGSQTNSQWTSNNAMSANAAGNISGATTANASTANASSGTSHSGADSLAQVQKIVNADPDLKRTVNEILTDSGKSSATLQ